MFLKFLQQAIKERGDISHAYLITGEVETATAEVISALKNIYPDVFVAGTDITIVKTDSFGIGESRKVRERAEVKPFGSRAIFILSAPSFTLEAQNALLKTLEEPEPGNYFFIVTESVEAILATLRSRLTPFSFGAALSGKDEVKEIEDFLSMSPKDRLAFVLALHVKKEKKPIMALVSSLERVVRSVLLKNPTDRTLLSYLECIVKSRGYLERPSGNAKLILETLALTIPEALQKTKE